MERFTSSRCSIKPKCLTWVWLGWIYKIWVKFLPDQNRKILTLPSWLKEIHKSHTNSMAHSSICSTSLPSIQWSYTTVSSSKICIIRFFFLSNFSSRIIYIFISNIKANKKNSCIASGSKDNILNVTNTCKGGKPPYIWLSSVKVRKANFPAHFVQPVFFNIFKVEALYIGLQPATSLSHWNKLCHRHQEVPRRSICQILSQTFPCSCQTECTDDFKWPAKQ